MTYAEAKEKGYKDGRTRYQRGYVSRKIDVDKQKVHTNKYGWMYVLLPCWKSSQYCVRRYLIAPKERA